ncbi:MAG: hypothetical protein OEW67_00805 [Cyclobacteriaceae bacterium]|nr:hypothetical protein [Cyclobacteriaceae bacterium]
MKKQFVLFIIIIILLPSCNTVFKAPPFTDVQKLLMLKSGMSIDKVKSVLGIDPYDVYHINEESSILLSFSYRLKERRYKIKTFNQDEILRKTTDEESQTKGNIAYKKKDPKTAYLLFKDNSLVSMITTEGNRKSETLMIQSNNIVKIDKENITDIDFEEVEEVELRSDKKTIKLFRKKN